MSTPYVGEIRLFGFPRVPVGWMACDGSLQSIAEYQTLYTLIGTTYGGDGQATFQLPDLRGRIPLHNGTGLGLTPRPVGQIAGTEMVTLVSNQIPTHTHTVQVSSSAATNSTPGPTVVPAVIAGENLYITFSTTPPASIAMSAQEIGITGQSLPHENCMATLTLSYCIAWAGVFPTRN
jgi:microcystin-dependent protein